MNDVRLARHYSDVKSGDVKSNEVRSTSLAHHGKGVRAWRRSYLFSALDLGLTEAIKRHVYPRAQCNTASSRWIGSLNRPK